MTRITPAALLLTAAFLAGCNAPQQTQSTQTTSSSDRRSANNDDYTRNYQSESHRHHHHRRDEPTTDGDTSIYDRVDQDRTESQSEQPRESRSRQHHNARAATAAPGQFDFYLLNLSWSPEFCHSHPSAAECAQHRAFTLHGLWPQNNDGTYPEDCSDVPGPSNPAQYADIYPDAGLLQHEWQTHGTCSGLAPDAFLALDRRAEQSIQIPSQLVHLTQAASFSPSQLVTLFTQSNPGLPAASLAISCGNNYLTAVEVCMDKSGKPEACSSVKTCGATQIRVPAPQ